MHIGEKTSVSACISLFWSTVVNVSLRFSKRGVTTAGYCICSLTKVSMPAVEHILRPCPCFRGYSAEQGP